MSREAAEVVLMAECIRPEHSVEETLIERVLGGETAAFDQIMRSHQHRVLSIAWRMLASQEEALDATQGVFLRAFKYLRSFKRGQDFNAWLYRIAINVCRDLRKRKRHRRTDVSFEEAQALGQLEHLASPRKPGGRSYYRPRARVGLQSTRDSFT